jgi:hypothetical protein
MHHVEYFSGNLLPLVIDALFGREYIPIDFLALMPFRSTSTDSSMPPDIEAFDLSHDATTAQYGIAPLSHTVCSSLT